MPDPALLTDRTREQLAMLPLWLREDPDVIGVVHAFAREGERAEDAIEQVRANLFPQTADLLLGAWEALVQTAIEGPGTLAQRQEVVMALLAQLGSALTGEGWELALTTLVGPVYRYQEHDPDDPSSPPPYTVRVTVPFPPGSEAYQRVERRLRVFTPANTDIVLAFTEGFVLDQSQLDQEPLQ